MSGGVAGLHCTDSWGLRTTGMSAVKFAKVHISLCVLMFDSMHTFINEKSTTRT